MSKLHLKMTAEQFKAGYWYASELKAFARSLDMRGYSKQRKDQLEARILQYLVQWGRSSSRLASAKGRASCPRRIACGKVQIVEPCIVLNFDALTKIARPWHTYK